MVKVLVGATANTVIFYAEVEEFLIGHDFDEEECKYQVWSSRLHGLIEKVVWEKLCGVRKPDRYLHHVYLLEYHDPYCGFVCEETEYSDRCGWSKDCEFFSVCGDEVGTYHEDL